MSKSKLRTDGGTVHEFGMLPKKDQSLSTGEGGTLGIIDHSLTVSSWVPVEGNKAASRN
jgi:hypothetical protein